MDFRGFATIRKALEIRQEHVRQGWLGGIEARDRFWRGDVAPVHRGAWDGAEPLLNLVHQRLGWLKILSTHVAAIQPVCDQRPIPVPHGRDYERSDAIEEQLDVCYRAQFGNRRAPKKTNLLHRAPP